MALAFRTLTVGLITLLVASTGDCRPNLRDGGVSGGGGNVINPIPPDRVLDGDSVEDIAKSSVSYARIYFKNVHAQYLAGEFGIFLDC